MGVLLGVLVNILTQIMDPGSFVLKHRKLSFEFVYLFKDSLEMLIVIHIFCSHI